MEKQWLEICAELKDKLEHGEYEVWIRPLKASINTSTDAPTVLSLYAKSSYTLNRVREKHYKTIQEIAKKALNDDSILLEFALLTDETNDYLLTPAKLAKELITAPAVLSTVQENFDLPLPTVRLSAQEKIIESWKSSFDNFIVGPSNKLAYAMAQDIIKPEASTEMLFLSSAPGLGKTHLTKALGKAIYTSNAKSKPNIMYLSSEEFASQFIHASRYKDIPAFKERFRKLDILLLEDIHFLRAKEKTQEELLNIVKNMQNNGKKVVFTSSFSPRDLNDLDSQLISRFSSGFVASIDYPDFETKKAMLMHKASLKDFYLPEKVAELVAEQLSGDIRLLESSIHNLVLHAKLLDSKQITEEMAYSVLSQVAQKSSQLSLKEMISLVCSCFGISEEQMRSTVRKQEFVTARNIAFYLLRKHYCLTLDDIGKQFNRRHPTVSKAIFAIENEIKRNTRLGAQYIHSVNAIEEKAGISKE